MENNQKAEEVFEANTWKEAVLEFIKPHKPENYQPFLQNYSTPDDTKKRVALAQKHPNPQYSAKVGKVLDKIHIFMRMGDLAIKAAPETIGLAWTGIRLCLNATQDDYDTFQLYTGACADMIGIMISCRVYGKSYSSKNRPPEFNDLHEKVLSYIGQAYQNILEFSYQMWKYSNEHIALRIAKGLLRSKKALVQSSIDALHRNEDQMNKYAEQASQQSLDYYVKQGLQNDQSVLGNLSSLLTLVQDMAQETRKREEERQKQQEEQAKKDSTKSGLEQAQQTFERQNKALAPPVALSEKLSAKIKGRKEGTCTWILTFDAFEKYKNAEGGNVSCLVGGAGSGKSFLMAAMVEHLQEMATYDKSIVVGFFLITRESEATSRPESIGRNLLSQIYTAASGSIKLMDDCNAIVEKYLQEQQDSSKTAMQRQRGDTEENTLARTLIEVAKLISKRIYLFVDALDECTDGNPQFLVNTLQSLVQTKEVDVNIFYSSRNDEEILSLLPGSIKVNVQDHTYDDLASIIRTEIDELPGLISTERELVCDEVRKKAGPSFNYVRLAMDFMRRPWRRPLSKHLQSLPDGIDSMYTQNIVQIDPVYWDLLVTCLTWTLLSARPLTVREIMDIYQLTYTDKDFNHADTLITEKQDLEQYERQINHASSAFLRIKDNKTVVTMHSSVREFFSRAQEIRSTTNSRRKEDIDCQCTRCVTAAQDERAIHIDDVQGHVQIVITILMHLSSKSFRRNYYFASTDNVQADEACEIDSSELTHDASDNDPVKFENPAPQRSTTDLDTVKDSDRDDTQITSLETSSNNTAAQATTSDSANLNIEQRYGLEVRNPSGKTQLDTPHLGEEDFDSLKKSGVEPPSNEANSDASDCLENAPIISDENEAFNNINSGGAAETSRDTINSSIQIEGREHEADIENEENQSITNSEDSLYVVEEDERPAAGSGNDEQTVEKENIRLDVRYEIQNLLWHLNQLEDLYPWHERSGENWESLRDLLLEFMDLKSEVWQEWIHEVFRTEYVLENIGIDVSNGLESIHPIHVAAFARLTSLVRLLIERDGAANIVNIKTSSQQSPLFGAIECRSLNADRYEELVTMLLCYGADPNNFSEYYGCSPFNQYLQAANTSTDQLQVFLDRGADVLEQDSSGRAAIHYFADGKGGLAVAQLLIKAGADIHRRSSSGETSMHHLVRREVFPEEVVQDFISRGAEIDAEDNASERPLRECAAMGHCVGLEMLLKHGAEIDDEDLDGRTALYAAVSGGHTEAVLLLLSKGADPSRLDSDQDTPFHLACRQGYNVSARLLGEAMMEKGSFHLACKPIKSTGETALMGCATKGLIDIMTMILENFVAAEELAFRSPKGRQALHFAASKAELSATYLLLQWGADIKSKDNKKKTALQLCYSQIAGKINDDRESTIILLAEHDPEAAVVEVELLHTLVIYNCPRAVSRLLDLGADPLSEDIHGWNALQLAEQYQRKEIRELILEHKRIFKIRPTKVICKPSKDYVLSGDGLEIEKVHSPDALHGSRTFEWQAMITDHPVPALDERYYFELSLEPRKDVVDVEDPICTMGLCQKPNVYKPLSQWHPGWYKPGIDSWGYHGDDGRFFHEDTDIEPDCTVEDTTYRWRDTVGCGVELKKGIVFWTRNGKRLVEVGFDGVCGQLYPVVSLQSRGKIRVNLGNNLAEHPFMWEPGNTLDFDSDIPPKKTASEGTS